MKKPKRIVFLAGPLEGNEGIISHIILVAKELKKRGWGVAVISGLKKKGVFEKEGIKSYFLPFPRFPTFEKIKMPGYLMMNARLFVRLNRIIRKLRPDIIHLHALSLSFYVFIFRLIYRIPYISTCHTSIKETLKFKLGHFATFLVPNFLGNRMIAVSIDMKNAFSDVVGVPKKNIRLVHHGINTSYFRPPTDKERDSARKEFQLKDDNKVVCLIGTINWIKGTDILIKAISKLKKNRLNIKVLLAGDKDPKMASQIKALIKEEKLSNSVRFLGFTDSRKVLWASDICAMPSRFESFLLVNAEAMSCGVVCIRTLTPGAKDQIKNGENGFIIPIDDYNALADRIKLLFDNPNLRSEMSKKAIESSKNFSVDNMMSKLVSAYDELT
jgi:glycosyltransferase involved in cell wall biosynthesis